ncbi:MAG: hypothetical protein LBP24_00870 [Coriobacteriales bacterium]|nr:hypothetical protein [Coriobacteriales bacterium]
MQRRQIRLALATLGVFCCFLVFLAVQQNREFRERAPGAMDYLFATDAQLPNDPLGIACQDIELVGVSSDGRVVGYATEYDVAQTRCEVDAAMRARGWMALEPAAQGIAGYVWQGASMQARDAFGQGVSAQAPTPAPGASVMLIYSVRDGGSSIVAELL